MKSQRWFLCVILIGTALLVAVSALGDQVEVPGSPVSEKRTGDSLNTTWMGAWAHGPCETVVVQGDYTYFGDGSYLHIVDISDPASPAKVGALLLP